MWVRLSDNCHYAWAYFWSGRTPAIALGILFALIALALLIASRTRWAQAKPITKCIVISVLAHVWILIYACGSRLTLPQGDPNGAMDSVAVSVDATRLEPAGPMGRLDSEVLTDTSEETSQLREKLPAWEQPLESSRLPAVDLMATAPATESQSSSVEMDTYSPTLLPELFEDSHARPDMPLDLLVAAQASPPSETAEMSLPTSLGANHSTPPGPVPMPMVTAELSAHRLPTLPSTDAKSSQSDPALMPAEYQLRQSADRLELARPFGADQDTEAAVTAALDWLASAQSPDGSWNALQYGGGTETFALGENRQGTGDRADTGITGLALLAFLSGGHTHLDGQYRFTVQRGLESLLRAQMPSGDLSGPKQIGSDASVTNARMYCHGIATLALAEAYALTHDVAVREPLLRSVRYTLDAQDPRGGGWRYRPGDAGDLSQFGWQAMALRSVERSGIRIDPIVKRRMAQFLDSCATGAHGGLARYRPMEGAPSPTMTAEAFACRLLLDLRQPAAAQREARALLMNHLPGSSQENVYYWYYATLALFQLQDESWQRWNVAMKSQLLRTQKPSFDDQPGSWEPDPLWGGYGGRVYSTAMSCMCLEVYYRYLPLYQR